MNKFEPGNFIIWHRVMPDGDHRAYAGTVRYANDYGVNIERYRKDSNGEFVRIPDFYPYDHLTRCQVVGNEAQSSTGGLCE